MPRSPTAAAVNARLASEGGKGERYGNQCKAEEADCVAYRVINGRMNCTKILSRMNNPKISALVRRRASKRSVHEPISRSNVAFIRTKTTTIRKTSGNNAALAQPAPIVIAINQHTQATAEKSARP